MIAEDLEHSQTEKRDDCFGKVQERMMTVRFTYRGKVIRIIEWVTGDKGEKLMSQRKPTPIDKDEPLGKLGVVPDFLPAPSELVLKEEAVKVTLALSKKSVDFFKEVASQHHTPYQKMIRNLLDQYAERFSGGVKG